jgi:hypothetical protein
MPIVAESPPIIFGGPTTSPTSTPTPTPTTTPQKTIVPGEFVAVHSRFISRINELSSCFKREMLTDFTDQDFLDHSNVAIIDKYIVQNNDMYCSMQGVTALVKTLKRLGEE